jgi:hypothetical protein
MTRLHEFNSIFSPSFDFIGKVRFGEPPKPAREPRAFPCSFHIRVRTFAAFGDEAVDPRRNNGQRDRAEL